MRSSDTPPPTGHRQDFPTTTAGCGWRCAPLPAGPGASRAIVPTRQFAESRSLAYCILQDTICQADPSPRTTLSGKTSQIEYSREKFGGSVWIWAEKPGLGCCAGSGRYGRSASQNFRILELPGQQLQASAPGGVGPDRRRSGPGGDENSPLGSRKRRFCGLGSSPILQVPFDAAMYDVVVFASDVAFAVFIVYLVVRMTESYGELL